MIASLKKITAAVTVASVLAVSAFAASPGYVDFDQMSDGSGDKYVEVDINGSLLRLAAAFTQNDEPEVAALLNNLERVRVNVFGVNDDNRAATLERMESLRGKLANEGWEQVVTVRENSGDNVAVFIKQAEGETIHGVVVTVMSGDGEAVLVNVVGDVAIEQIAKLGDSLDIKPLRELKLKEAHGKSA
ncbi:DUF4252 domain-containing protein [Actomonas aquatica]|uniref:DUF4252 domain-containing protein n=1 Tax=Actomonas aquatica TaxID=2866162 RepID=A0ABZ1CEG2_9BACT|nr:DUF4252 domain-containing protein [Opitutus sp. WL0086]WRQ89004.1 DUF4252 domain-containing protein [Opitutus sp. WL0086]